LSLDEAGELRAWDRESWTELRSLRQAAVIDFAFAPNGRTLLVAGKSEARFWDVENLGQPILTKLPRPPAADIREELGQIENPLVTLARDGEHLAVVWRCSRMENVARRFESIVEIWNARLGKRLGDWRIADEEVDRVRFSSDAAYLVSESPTARCLWDCAAGREVLRIGERDAPYDFAPNGDWLAFCDGDKTCLFALTTRKVERRLAVDKPVDLRFSHDGKMLFAASGQGVDRFDVASGEKRGTIVPPTKRKFDNLVPNEGGPMLLREAQVRVKGEQNHLVDATTGRLVSTRDGMHLLPGGKQMLIEDSFVGLQFRDVATGRLLGVLPIGHRGGHLRCVFDPRAKLLATFNSDQGGDVGVRFGDSSILIRTLPAENANVPAQVFDLSPADLDRVWRECVGNDVSIETFAGAPRQSIPFLVAKLEAMPPLEPKGCPPLSQLIDDLKSDNEARADEAEKGIRKFGRLAEFALREVDAEAWPKMAADRLQTCKYAMYDVATDDASRADMAFHVLSLLATPECRQTIERLSRGDERSWLTARARAALRHMDRTNR